MARKVVTTYVSDLSDRNIPERDLAAITITVGEFSFKLDAHKDDSLADISNVRGLMERARKVQKPGRKEGSTNEAKAA